MSQHFDALSALSARGAGVYVVINKGGRRARDITSARGVVFADLDGVPLENLKRLGLKPHRVIETSPGKFQAYWRVADLPVDGLKN